MSLQELLDMVNSLSISLVAPLVQGMQQQLDVLRDGMSTQEKHAQAQLDEMNKVLQDIILKQLLIK